MPTDEKNLVKVPYATIKESMPVVHSDLESLFDTSNYLTAGVLSASTNLLNFFHSTKIGDMDFLDAYGEIVITQIVTGKTRNQKKIELDLDWKQIYHLCEMINDCATIWGESSKIEKSIDFTAIFGAVPTAK